MKPRKKIELIQDLRGGNTHHHQSQGERTRNALDKRGVLSPNVKEAIQISPGLKITPREELLTDLDRLKWIERMKIKYNVK